MKKLNLLFSKICLAALLSLPIVFTSCSDDDTPVNAPKIVNPGIAADTVVAKGSSFAIEPQLSDLSPALYSWTMNGAEVSKEKSYTFTATTPGTYNLAFSTSNEAGTAQTAYTINVRSYFGGFYIVNEGWFGHETGSVCYYGDKKWTNRLFQENNPGKTLGTTTTNGVISGNNIYFVSKDSPLLVETDLNDFKQKSAIESTIATGKGNNFCVINAQAGVLTTANGAYMVTLNPLGLGQQLSQASTGCKDITQVGKYVFIISTNNILVYNASNATFVKALKLKATTGFAQSKDGSLWAANGNTLIKINTTDLTTENISLPDGTEVYYNSTYTPSGLRASTTANALYFAKSDGRTSKDGYRYDIDTKTLTKIVSAPEGYSFYGSCLSVNPANGYVYATFIEEGWGDHSKNCKILVVNGSNATTIETIDYSGQFWFPSVIVFE